MGFPSYSYLPSLPFSSAKSVFNTLVHIGIFPSFSLVIYKSVRRGKKCLVSVSGKLSSLSILWDWRMSLTLYAMVPISRDCRVWYRLIEHARRTILPVCFIMIFVNFPVSCFIWEPATICIPSLHASLTEQLLWLQEASNLAVGSEV